MKFSKKNKCILYGLLVILNIIIRIPSTPHETGVDSFLIHTLANSISVFGQANWWINPLSVFGFYPYSYASVVPFSLSGISQSANLDMELTILIFNIIVGTFSVFTMYLLAGAIKDDDLFKFLVAFGFSISQGVLVFTTWNISTRGFFTVFFPLFIYLVLMIRVHKIRALMLVGIISIFLAGVHHFIWFTGTVILAFLVVFVLKPKLNKFTRYVIPSNASMNLVYMALLLLLLLIPFVMRTFFEVSKYTFIIDLIMVSVRKVGFSFIFVFGGIVYLALKNNKSSEEWFLLLIMLFFSPFVYIIKYTIFLIVSIYFLFIGIGLTNIYKLYKPGRKYILNIIIVTMLLSTVFSGFYQHWHTGLKEGRSDWYMNEETYAGGLWIKDAIRQGNNLVGNGGIYNLASRRMFAVSGGKLAVLTNSGIAALTYGLFNESYIKVRQISPLSTEFYMGNPYMAVGGRSMEGRINYISGKDDIDVGNPKRIVDEVNLKYMIEDTKIRDPIIRSVHERKNNIYDSGNIRIWVLDNSL